MKLTLFQIVLLGILVVGALIGLYVFATYTSKNTDDTIGTVTIWGTLPKTEIEAAFTAIKQTEQGLKYVTYVKKDPAALPQELSAAIATGAAPDLILASQEELYALSRFIAPIPHATLPIRAFTDTFAGEGSLFLAPGEAGYFGVPFLIDPLVLFSNRAILSSSGIARPPSTWEALVGLVPSIATLTPTRQVTRGLIAFGTYDNVKNARGILSSLFFQAGVPISFYSATGGLVVDLVGKSSSEGAPRGNAVVSFYTQFADPSKVSYTWNASLPDSERMFLRGDLALYPAYASRARYLSAANPNLDFDASPLPQPSTATTKVVYGLIYAFMIPRGAPNPSGAYQVAVLLSNPTAQATSALHTGLAPAVLSELAKPPRDPIAAVAYSSALYSKGWLSPPGENADRLFSSMIGDVISGRSAISVALGSAERALGALFQR